MVGIDFQVSIVVPVYKVEDYLSACVESILAQSFHSFELLLIDDGSPDKCPEICDKYAQKDNRIRVIHQKNMGLSAARNTGIKVARGAYICFVDSDDILDPEYCSILYQAAVFTKCDMAACKMRRFVDESDIPVEKKKIETEALCAMPYEVFLKRQLGQEIEMGVCNRLFHKSLFSKLCFMEGKLHEDIIFAGDLLEKTDCSAVYVDVELYYYRQRPSSIVNQQVNSACCSPDRVFAGKYLLDCARRINYAFSDECLDYAVRYPWFFVDSNYVHFQVYKNRKFMNALQELIQSNLEAYRELDSLNQIQRKRMTVFAKSKVLYGFNAYARLFRVYLYRVLNKDAYADGHGI